MTTLTLSRTKLAKCPSCRKTGQFEFAHEQRWPEKVAKACGKPSVIRNWHCPHCHTTISEPELLVPPLSRHKIANVVISPGRS